MRLHLTCFTENLLRECKDFIHDPLFESVQRHETCRVNQHVWDSSTDRRRQPSNRCFLLRPQVTTQQRQPWPNSTNRYVQRHLSRAKRFEKHGRDLLYERHHPSLPAQPAAEELLLIRSSQSFAVQWSENVPSLRDGQIFSEFYSTDPGASSSNNADMGSARVLSSMSMALRTEQIQPRRRQ